MTGRIRRIGCDCLVQGLHGGLVPPGRLEDEPGKIERLGVLGLPRQNLRTDFLRFIGLAALNEEACLSRPLDDRRSFARMIAEAFIEEALTGLQPGAARFSVHGT